jgi:hypothetical protein
MRPVAALAILLAGGAAWWVRGQSAAAGAPVWEFATVEALHETWYGNFKSSTANICYHVGNGCRWETVRITVQQWGQINDALAAATARMGERGWEPVAVTQLSPDNRPSVLMKRIRPGTE